MTQFGFVLGNGKTRKQVDPVHLKSAGRLYVCNRAAEEMSYDVCVAVDKQISTELQKKGYVIHTRSNAVQTPNGIPIQKNFGWSSGPVAATYAALNGHAYIFLIGMDLISDTASINNLYVDTPHYLTSDSPPTPHGNWISQINTLIKEFSSQRFIHVNPLNGFTPDTWQMHKNFSIQTLAQFETMINNTTE